MGGIAEMAKKQEASVRRRMHREEGLKQIPTTNNYIDLTIVDLKLRNITFENNSVITVVDILATEEKDTKLQTTIHKTQLKGALVLITEIICPICGNIVEYHEKWEAYVCLNHDKKAVFEVRTIEIVDKSEDGSNEPGGKVEEGEI